MFQFILNGVIAAAVYSLAGVSFCLVYRVTRVFNFTHGVLFALGAYLAFLCTRRFGLSLAFSIFVAVIGCMMIGACLDLFVFRSLRRKRGSVAVSLLASLGLYIVLQNCISLAFGDYAQTIRLWSAQVGYNVFGGNITMVQISIVTASVVVAFITAGILDRTRFGKLVRAVANDTELAATVGISSDKVILATIVIASAMAGLAGILVALDADMTPTMGMNLFMFGIVVMVLGGSLSVVGIVMGALFLGLIQHLGVWVIGSQWQEAIAFGVLVFFLILRPQGFVGKSLRKATV